LESSITNDSLRFDIDDEASKDVELTKDEVVIPDKKLTLLSGNMDAEAEISVRSFLLSRMNQWFIKGETESITTSMEIESKQIQLYSKGIFSKQSGFLDYVICFLSSSVAGLELFQNDLDTFSIKLAPHLQKYTDSIDTTHYWKEFESWHSTVLSFVKDCLSHFDYDLSTLLCAGFCGDTVIINNSVPRDMKKKIERFLECCSLSALFRDGSSENKINSSTSLTDLVSLENPTKISIDVNNEGVYTVTPSKRSTFCDDCVKQLKVNHSMDYIQIRQMIENFKLKNIQDMNTFRRLLTQAEVDFYACYKTYLFLLTSGNGVVLMHNSRLQSNLDEPKTKRLQQVLDTLEQFIQMMGGYAGFDTKENKETLINKTGPLRYN